MQLTKPVKSGGYLIPTPQLLILDVEELSSEDFAVEYYKQHMGETLYQEALSEAKANDYAYIAVNH